jgi:hypothetical protein
MTRPNPKRSLWRKQVRRDLGPDIIADLHGEADETTSHLLGDDPDAQGRAAEQLLGRGVREAVRR